MAYDVTLFNLGPSANRTFPCGFEAAPNGPAPLPWFTLRSRILQRGGHKNGDYDCIWMEHNSGDSIGFHGNDRSVALDLHCQWKNFLEIYEDLLRVEPNLVIFDDRRSCFHNEASFRQYLLENGFMNC